MRLSHTLAGLCAVLTSWNLHAATLVHNFSGYQTTEDSL